MALSLQLRGEVNANRPAAVLPLFDRRDRLAAAGEAMIEALACFVIAAALMAVQGLLELRDLR